MKIHLTLDESPNDLNFPIEATYIANGGLKRGPYAFTVGEAIELIGAAAAAKESFQMKLLPKNTLYSEKERNFQAIAVLQEKSKRYIRYSDMGEEQLTEIPFPRMILHYDLLEEENGFRLLTAKAFAVKEGEITEDTPLYHFPYPNVAKETGLVCWGLNNSIMIPALSQIEQLFNIFASAPFNEDYGIALLMNNVGNFRTAINVLKEKDFDDEWLMPTDKTLKTLLNN